MLDVGSGPIGLSCVFPEARFAGQDVAFPTPVAREMFAVRTDPGRFPWADGAFDTVVCLDVLEHVAADQRSSLVAECARVASRRVLLACPTDTAVNADEFFVELYRSRGEAPPSWLNEHMELGLPTSVELEAACAVPGFRHKHWPQVNGLLASLVVVGDLHPFFASGAASEYSRRQPDWIAALQACRFGDGVRQGVELERIDARQPIADPQRFDETIAQALECPGCRGFVRSDVSGVLTCSSCGRIATRDEAGALDLRRDALTAPGKLRRARDRLRRR